MCDVPERISTGVCMLSGGQDGTQMYALVPRPKYEFQS